MNSLEAIVAGFKKMWPAQLLKDGVITTRLIWLGVLGILLLLFGGVLDNLSTKPNTEAPTEIVKIASPSHNSYEEVLEEKIANILTKVKGAGAVAVNITLENSSTQEHAKNIVKESKVVQEKDASGGIRTTTETKESEQLIIGKENGVDRPVIVREIKPIIKGVLVIAEGAYDSTVKANLTKAIEAGLGIPTYKITVLAQRK
jgi:stage III sporulation protein AG